VKQKTHLGPGQEPGFVNPRVLELIADDHARLSFFAFFVLSVVSRPWIPAFAGMTILKRIRLNPCLTDRFEMARTRRGVPRLHTLPVNRQNCNFRQAFNADDELPDRSCVAPTILLPFRHES